MATQQDIENLIQYYVNLLIIQYHNQPNAQATIALFVGELLANNVYFDVLNAYNINPALGPVAVGDQLDVIGKYVGIDRYYSAIDLANYFAMVNYSQHSSLPSSPPAFGFGTYATFPDYDYNGTLVYNDIVTSQNALSDADFLLLIQFMILCNNMNYSAYAIDSALWNIFGNQVHAESNYNMSMTFFFIGPISTLLNTIIFKGLLPVPEGVGFTVVENIADLMFAMTDYAQVGEGVYSAFGYGFSTYSNYATLAGQVLEYSQIS